MDKSSEISREKFSWLLEQPMDIKVSLLQQHLSICQLVINQILEEEVRELSGARYSHDKLNAGRYSRYGFNPGSVEIDGKRLRIEVPRVRDAETGKFCSLSSYSELKDIPGPDEQTVAGVWYSPMFRQFLPALKIVF